MTTLSSRHTQDEQNFRTYWYCGHPKFTRRNAREIIKRNFSIKNVT